MAYTLQKLAPGSYDLLLDGIIVGSVVQNGNSRGSITWVAELLENLPSYRRPSPFRDIEHQFNTLREVREWLGIPESGALRAAA